jgi:hypothetical protein
MSVFTQGVLTKAKATVADYRTLPEEAKHQRINGEIIFNCQVLRLNTRGRHVVAMHIGNIVFEWRNGTILFAPIDILLSNENTFQPAFCLCSTNTWTGFSQMVFMAFLIA